MNVVLIRLREGGTGSRSWLEEGQSLTVGRSHHADLCVEDDSQLSDVHFRVEVKAGTCHVHNLAGKQGMLMVNGNPVLESVLRDQDTIHAGKSRFRVSIDDPRGTVLPSAQEKPSDIPDMAALQVFQRPMPAGIQAVQVVEGGPHLGLIAERLGQGKTVSLAANFKRANWPLPEGIAAEEDLFRHAPPEIRATESLHLLALDEPAAAAQQAGDLGKKDAGILVVSGKTRQEFLASHKLYWGWFIRPSLLTFQLSKGSADLAAKLFQDIYAAVVASSSDGDLVVYCHPEDAAAIEVSLSTLEAPVTPNDD